MTVTLLSPSEKRERFGEGPWVDEPDHVVWSHKGFPCLIERHDEFGTLCGYIAVSPGHPWFETSYHDLNEVEVHRGLTYARKNAPGGPPDGAWWLGFDTSHLDCDYNPGMEVLFRSLGVDRSRLQVEGSVVYRDLAYVKTEVERLADQAFAARSPS